MAAAIAMELRTRVMKDIDAGKAVERVAEKYSVSARTIYNWKAYARFNHARRPDRRGTLMLARHR